MEVRFIGELQDKRAVCPYCQTQVDLPDSFERVQQKRTHEQHIDDSRTVEETIIETRRNGDVPAQSPGSLPPELQEILRALQAQGPGGLDDQLLQKLKESGINITYTSGSTNPQTLQGNRESGFDEEAGSVPNHISKTKQTRVEEQNQGFFGRLFSKKEKNKEKFTPLSTSEIIKLAGGALAPEKRRQCPNPQCGATIPKDAPRCSWCGKSL